MTSTENRPIVQIDIVSDVVCPWCIVGFKQLDTALQQMSVLARLRWHPFELNPNMPREGQNLRDHIMEKYGTTAEQSQQARDRLTSIGAELGFTFNFGDESRMVNTFAAHQLLDWAEGQGRQHPLKLALFDAYFTRQKDVSDTEVLLDAVRSVGLDAEAARQALESGKHTGPVREKQQFWTSRGISGVPSMVFGGKYLLTGAQGTETYAQVLQRCLSEAA
ncbi:MULTISPECIES: DsbA family oxidoreductase [unclassified Ruegeria]|uniref:DsbA family oxidoreductase n=1 Tax=unclassified Ruegeria TaxID=2625375 RepID=UPI001491F7CE|nr:MULTISPECIES: DsbA family oxidoreductase [unclassified Ruegeria]NOD87042.1 DsbA family oxidoreductase [Ruegeria sp. HKCCD4318]NOE12597.1 DsbA family oxidoreductase [Ruegeria sp. HKCCD4318-2]NOG09238.1 DsbA family oxidoreductase [Ruegeria sp. HKCCD4315]